LKRKEVEAQDQIKYLERLLTESMLKILKKALDKIDSALQKTQDEN
jgi:hypothetical protein